MPPDTRVVRVMPNTPAIVQSAASVFTLGSAAHDEDAETVTEMLSCVGLVEEMPEHLMDAVTGLGGNGPAYVSPEWSLITLQLMCPCTVKWLKILMLGFHDDSSLV